MGHNENKIYSNLLRIIIHDFSGCDTTSKQNQETLNEETTNDILLPIQDSLPQFKVAQYKEETFMIKSLEMREIFGFNEYGRRRKRYFVRIHRFQVYRALLLQISKKLPVVIRSHYSESSFFLHYIKSSGHTMQFSYESNKKIRCKIG